MVFRRLLALILMFALPVSNSEAVFGELRDGEIHHETTLAAAVHAQQAGGDHGHEDAEAPTHRHGDNHQHGTGADHCTHQHGTPLPVRASFRLISSTTIQAVPEPRVHTAWTPSLLFHPPKA